MRRPSDDIKSAFDRVDRGETRTAQRVPIDRGDLGFRRPQKNTVYNPADPTTWTERDLKLAGADLWTPTSVLAEFGSEVLRKWLRTRPR